MLDENYNIKIVSQHDFYQSLQHNFSNASTFHVQIDFGDAKKENEPPIEDDPQPTATTQAGTDGDDPVNEFAEDMMSMHSDGGMDRRGTLVGTMNYLAPEMI